MHKLALFRKWAQEAPLGAVFVYYNENIGERDPDIFEYARKLSEAGRVFLFQKRTDQGTYQYCARRSSVAAHGVLDKVSASIKVEPSRQKDAA